MNDAYVHDTREAVDHFVLLTGSLDSDRQVLSAKDSKQTARRGSRWMFRWENVQIWHITGGQYDGTLSGDEKNITRTIRSMIVYLDGKRIFPLPLLCNHTNNFEKDFDP